MGDVVSKPGGEDTAPGRRTGEKGEGMSGPGAVDLLRDEESLRHEVD